MLAGAVAGVDHRHRGDLRRAGRRALLGVAEHDTVGVTADDADRVLQGLPFDRRREVAGVLGPDHQAAHSQHRGLEAEPGAGAGLVEDRCHDPPAKWSQLAGLKQRLHGPGALKQAGQKFPVELAGRNHMLQLSSARAVGHHCSPPGWYRPARAQGGGGSLRHAPCRPRWTGFKVAFHKVYGDYPRPVRP